MNETNAKAEELAFLCLERMGREGESALEEICRQHPEHEESIRGVVKQLQDAGLIDGSVSDDPVDWPDRIGEFKILERIGAGGMGIVYLAQQPRLGRKVALKLIRSESLLFKNSRERFRREIEAISKLDHPGICTVYEAGETDGIPYLAMRYIDGETLSDVIARQGSRSHQDHSSRSNSSQIQSHKLEVIEKVARALHTAHEAGIAHRDIKPANIMLDQDGQPVILDFGLAFVNDEDHPDLTASGEQIGTPAYMSPEQIKGQKVTTRTDVYALGAVLYEYLTSREAFEGKSRESLYRAILTEDVFSTRKKRRLLSKELRTVVSKAMEKDPQRRFATALEFAEELRRIRMHEPIRTAPPGIGIRTVHWVQRNPTAAGILATTAVGLITTLLFLFQSQRSNTRFHALALLESASRVEQENPVLGFKLAREALRVDASPTVMGRIQEIMFRLRPFVRLQDDSVRPGSCAWSPDGRYAIVSTARRPLRLYAADGQLIDELCEVARGGVRPYAFSASSDLLAVGDDAGVIHRYRLSAGSAVEVTQTLDPPQVQRPCFVSHLAYREDGYLLCTYRSGHSRLWRADGSRVSSFARGPADPAWHAGAFLPDGRIVASGAIWDRGGQHQVRRLRRIRDQVLQVLPCGDSILIRSGNREANGRIWRLPLGSSPRVVRTFVRDTRSELTFIDATKDGSRILAVLQDGSLHLLDRSLATVTAWHSSGCRTTLCARFNPRRDVIAVGSWGGLVELFDLEGKSLDSMAGHMAGVCWLDWSPDGERILSCSIDGHARIWLGGRMPGVRMQHARGWVSVAASRSGHQLAYCDEDGVLALLTPEVVVERETAIPPGWYGVGYLLGEDMVFAANDERGFFLWDHESEAAPRLDRLPKQILGSPTHVGKGKWVMLRYAPRAILLWDQVAGNLNAISGNYPWVSSYAVSRDRIIAIGSRDSGIHFCNLEGEEIRPPIEVSSIVMSLAFSKDGHQILAGTSDKEAILWNLDTGRKTVLSGHQNGVYDVAFSLEDERIATASRDGWIRVWDPKQPARPVLMFRAHRTGIRHLVFLQGSQIVTSGIDGAIKFWQMDIGKLREIVDQIPIPALTNEERQAYVEGMDGR